MLTEENKQLQENGGRLETKRQSVGGRGADGTDGLEVREDLSENPQGTFQSQRAV